MYGSGIRSAAIILENFVWQTVFGNCQISIDIQSRDCFTKAESSNVQREERRLADESNLVSREASKVLIAMRSFSPFQSGREVSTFRDDVNQVLWTPQSVVAKANYI